VVGETPNLAARLQAFAEPGQIVLAGATRRLIGDLFRLRDLARQAVKGFAGPVEAFMVEGAAVVESRFEAARRGLTDLVGRAVESALLPTACTRPGPVPARSSCSRARPASASHGSAFSSLPRSRGFGPSGDQALVDVHAPLAGVPRDHAAKLGRTDDHQVAERPL